MSLRWIDMHAHLNMLDISVDEALREAKLAGVERVITIGTTPDDLPVVENLANKYTPEVFCTLGVHPHDARLFTSDVGQYILEHAQNQRVVAIGEIGLDYYYEHSPKDVQLEAFRQQMRMAETLGLPIEVHTRDAESETLQVLQEFEGRVRGLLHCFTGSWDLAKAALDLGYHISFSGVLTFKKAEALREVCLKVPLDRLHVETDAPFLAPTPHRGKKNQPALMVETAKCVAEIKKISLEDLAKQIEFNAHTLFPRLA